jgi:nucleoside-diphosphate-sugar epimerase
MKISILGLGWYGTPLAIELRNQGHDIYGSTRSEEKVREFRFQNLYASTFSYPNLPSEDLINSEIVILNIPPFEEQLDWFKSFDWNPETWVIFISSTSVYPQPESKNGHILKAQEDWIQDHFKKWTILRFGGLYGADRHPGKYLSGRKNLAGRLAPVNLIHQDDCVEFTKTVIKDKLQNILFNCVSDDHRTREEFYSEYCLKAGIPIPEFDESDFSKGKIVPNDEMKKYYQLIY